MLRERPSGRHSGEQKLFLAGKSWLDKTPEILDLVHNDTRSALSSVNAAARRRRARFKYTSEHVLRNCIAQVIEGVSLRGIVVRIDDSRSLPVFTRICDAPMMEFTTLDRTRTLLLPAAIESHKRLFGAPPVELAADRGYWPGKDALDEIQDEVELVSLGKKGRPNGHDRQREADPLFRHAQRFRAGVEGTISFLKRVLGLARCIDKGWRNYVSTISTSVFAHNLLVLARC